MFNLTFNYNPEQIKRWAESQVQSTVQRLRDRSDKTFTISLNGKKYNLRYEISETGLIDLYLVTDDVDDYKLARPTLQLNVGDFLLPESMTLDIPSTGYNPDVSNTSVTELNSSGVTDQEVASLKVHIQKTGYFNLLSDK